MKKIRIGNDIRLDVTLLGTKYVDSVNIKSLEAFIINVSKECEMRECLENKTRFINRFPVEPFVDAYSSTEHNINSCGYPTWRAYPKDHVFAPYTGFGVYPDWRNKYMPIPRHNLTEFKAPVKSTSEKNRVSVYFPAEAQLYTGTYKLVIVARIHEPGYALNNLRTITMDYENLFILVNSTDEEGVDSAVTLTVGINGDGDGNDKYVQSGHYADHNINLEYNTGGSINIPMWYEET